MQIHINLDKLIPRNCLLGYLLYNFFDILLLSIDLHISFWLIVLLDNVEHLLMLLLQQLVLTFEQLPLLLDF